MFLDSSKLSSCYMRSTVVRDYSNHVSNTRIISEGTTLVALLQETDLLDAYNQYEVLFKHASSLFKNNQTIDAFNVIFKIWMDPKIVPALLLRECFYAGQVILPAWEHSGPLFSHSLPKKLGGTRPILVPNKQTRICMGAVNAILQASCESWHPHTTGFRPSCGTLTAVDMLADKIKVTLRTHGRAIIVSFDIAKAFNSVHVDHLFNTLHLNQLPHSMKNHMWQWQHLNTKSGTTGDGVRRPLLGLVQGFPYSPTLFAWYLDALVGKGSEFIAYADNFVGVFESDWDAQYALARIQQKLAAASLVVAPHTIKFHTQRFQRTNYHWLGHEIKLPTVYVQNAVYCTPRVVQESSCLTFNQWVTQLKKSQWLHNALSRDWRFSRPALQARPFTKIF
uniref:RTL n=1 Tax=Edaphochlamys debaryana TaxID=47281 RepID=A0A7L9CWU9_9CHLO|nr:RTL [Edaphochlamys debaryana]